MMVRSDAERAAEAQRSGQELNLTNRHFDALKMALFERWISTPLDASAHREKLYNAATAVEYVRSALQRSVQDGQMLAHTREIAELLAPPKAS